MEGREGGREPTVTVGIMDRQKKVKGRLNGEFYGDGFGPLRGGFLADSESGEVTLFDEEGREAARSPRVRFITQGDATFTLFGVTIGNSFHWERREDQTFRGDLVLQCRPDGSMAVINEIPLEKYLESVVSSEMSARAPEEFLKVHSILSRSWLLSALDRKKKAVGPSGRQEGADVTETELTRWYEQEDHDLYDVCADDHCQRYQGITKIVSGKAGESVFKTRGQALTYDGKICDARYYKSCGGLTEEFKTAWEDIEVPYLVSISDATVAHAPVVTEDDAALWILSEPDAYCNTRDKGILDTILPDFDRETEFFYRWQVEYGREELEEILKAKSGFDFGILREVKPLKRGPSGRISKLRITGSKRSMIVGKELEIRRWLSKSHLYSSAFIVRTERGADGEIARFVFNGAGWGHGVGLCQIGAAVMATRGFSAEEILGHYFPGTKIKEIY